MTVTVADIIAALAAAFPRQALTPATLAVYMEDLSDLPVPELAAAATGLRRRSNFFPTIAELRSAVAEAMLGLPGESEALAQVEARDAVMHPLVKQALGLVGGRYAYRTSDEPGVIRGQFLRLYKDLRAETVRSAQLDANLLPHTDRPQLVA